MVAATIRVENGRFVFAGPFSALAIGGIWTQALKAAAKNRGTPLVIDISGVTSLDTSGAALLLAMEQTAGAQADLIGADDREQALLTQMRTALADAKPSKSSPPNRPGLVAGLTIRVAFFGGIVLSALALPGKLRFLRGSDFANIAEKAGTQALPLVLMLGFLIGMILAFQSAIPMRQFGADLYVADLVAISLFRELGPLLVAVILSGRTGSAFAAELGTMQVNEEIAALTTMGIDPETMLVLPRIAAAVMVMPVLVVAMDIAGLIGMGTVLGILGFPPSAVINEIISSSGPSDFLLGMIKGLVFAAAVALIGCRAGLTAGNGPQAVGEAATSAVVGGIVATVLLDGLFAVLTYRLGL
jgi:phospholipid/cholesterol/gamma-HCH transport system permease protein